jgi:hypothetical protein
VMYLTLVIISLSHIKRSTDTLTHRECWLTYSNPKAYSPLPVF